MSKCCVPHQKTFIMKLISFGLVLPVLVATLIFSSFSIAAQDSADKDMQAVLDAQASLKPKPIEIFSPAEVRKHPTSADAVNVVPKKQGKNTAHETLVPRVVSVDRSIAGAAGKIRASACTHSGSGSFPVIFYHYGGDWVIGEKQVCDGGACGLAKQASTVIVSADYRSTQEHKLTAAWNDTPPANKWTLANAASINGDPKKLALKEESAGGNLTVATANASVSLTSSTTESHEKNANAKPLNQLTINCVDAKLVNSPSDLKDQRIQFTDAKLQGLPLVPIIISSIDPLLSDGVRSEDPLKKSRLQVEPKMYQVVTYNFFGMATVV